MTGRSAFEPPAATTAGSLSEDTVEIGAPGDALGLSPGEPDRPKARSDADSPRPGEWRRHRRCGDRKRRPCPTTAHGLRLGVRRIRCSSTFPATAAILRGFDDLARRIGVDGDDVRVFDYRWAWPSNDPIEASRRATRRRRRRRTRRLPGGARRRRQTDLPRRTQQGWGRDHRGCRPMGSNTRSSGLMRLWGRPSSIRRSRAGRSGCSRAWAGFTATRPTTVCSTPSDAVGPAVGTSATASGEKSGVEVVIVRNPDAGFTNFRDRPDGVRVYDLDDGGGGMLESLPEHLRDVEPDGGGAQLRAAQRHRRSLHRSRGETGWLVHVADLEPARDAALGPSPRRRIRRNGSSLRAMPGGTDAGHHERLGVADAVASGMLGGRMK